MGIKSKIKKKKTGERWFSWFSVILCFSFLVLYACASIGNPSGGDFDITPPVLVKSKPAPNSTHFNSNKIELIFNEFIGIEKPAEKVIITPPQQKMPVIKAVGKKIVVELKDSLIANTTYTFDFTNGIVDNNEKNAIEGFAFAVSTGDIVDSLMISGKLLNAENLEPMPNIMVGLHSNPADSAFTTLPFLRTSLTNDRGEFRIRNIAPGTYKVYALNDANRDYRFDRPTEDIAFHDSLIVPSFEPAIRTDTLWLDSLKIDTIKEVQYTRFTPDDLMLYLFKEKYDNQYLSKTERPIDRQIALYFNSTKGLPPTLRILENESNDGWFIPEYSPDKRNITYWITDSLIYKRDTLYLEVNHPADDSLLNLISVTDTSRLILRNKKEVSKKKKDEEPEIEFLQISLSTKSVMDVFDTVKFTFSEPILDLDPNKIQIQQKVDTLWEDRTFPLVRDTLNPRIFYIENRWPYEAEYRITIDSAAIYSIYDKWNNLTNAQFKLYSEKDYGKLFVKVSGRESAGFGELLDNTDRPLHKSFLYDDELVFEDLKPGKYYLRYIEDTNGNGEWDTGNYAEHRSAEKVYYFEGFFEIRKFSEFEQEWNIKNIPVSHQKPLDITKNKPVIKQPKRNEQPTNRNQRQNATNRPASTGSQSNRTLQQNRPEIR